MDTYAAVVNQLTNRQLDQVARAILVEASRLEKLPRDLEVAVRMAGDDLAAVDVREEISQGAMWSYTPGHQVLREVEAELHSRFDREWISATGTEKITVSYSGHWGNFPEKNQSQPLTGVWVKYYAFDGIQWVPVEGPVPRGCEVINDWRSFVPHGHGKQVTGYLIAIDKIPLMPDEFLVSDLEGAVVVDSGAGVRLADGREGVVKNAFINPEGFTAPRTQEFIDVDSGQSVTLPVIYGGGAS
jgi:hypothetical protein